VRFRMPSPAMVVALLALFVALGGSSYAALKLPKGSVGPKQLKKNAVTSSKVKPGSLLTSDFKASQRSALRGPQGAQGAQGAQGPQGPGGPEGPPAATEPQFLTGTTELDSTSPKQVQVECPAGKTAIAGGYGLGGELPNLVVRQDGHPGAGFTDRWSVHVYEVPASAAVWELHVRALCVKLL
jgi:hypothetical protein